MTSPQYKMLAKFITAIKFCVHCCGFLSAELQFAQEWHSVLRMAVKMAAIVRFSCDAHAYIPPVSAHDQV